MLIAPDGNRGHWMGLSLDAVVQGESADSARAMMCLLALVSVRGPAP